MRRLLLALLVPLAALGFAASAQAASTSSPQATIIWPTNPTR